MTSEEIVERVRDFVYDCTKDEFDHGWTLSAHQTEDLIKLIGAALGDVPARQPIEITEEMIEAGINAALLYDPSDDLEMVVHAIYSAMRAVDPQV
jgi:methanogenic corrinoid protein MtbC1